MRGTFLSCLAAFFILTVACPDALPATEESGCYLCHSLPLAVFADNGITWYGIDRDKRNSHPHNQIRCRTCHPAVSVIPHRPSRGEVDCSAPCHSWDPINGNDLSHAALAKTMSYSLHGREQKNLLWCRDCHQQEGMEMAPPPLGGGKWCLGCHLKRDFPQWERYLVSPHGQPLARGLPAAASCPDCHTSHQMAPSQNFQSSTYRDNRPETCRGAFAGNRTCHPAAGDSLAGLGGHVSLNEAAGNLFPGIREKATQITVFFLVLGLAGLIPYRRSRE